MKIFITGARGQLGRDCAQVLGTEHTVYPFGSQDLDIADPGQVRHYLLEVRPDVVINCGAYTAVDGCETDRENCWRVNADGAGVLALACHEIEARLIHISTDYVFDGSRQVPLPYRETDPVHPLSWYGTCKLSGEEQIKERLQDHLILRTAWLYGINGRNFLKTMLRLAVTDPKRSIRVVNDQYGSLTWTHRLARQIQVLLTAELTGTVHATAEGYGTWYDGARVFLEAMRIPFSLEPCRTKDYPTPARRPANSILANELLQEHRLNRMASWKEDIVTFAGRFRERLLAEVSGETMQTG